MNARKFSIWRFGGYLVNGFLMLFGAAGLVTELSRESGVNKPLGFFVLAILLIAGGGLGMLGLRRRYRGGAFTVFGTLFVAFALFGFSIEIPQLWRGQHRTVSKGMVLGGVLLTA